MLPWRCVLADQNPAAIDNSEQSQSSSAGVYQNRLTRIQNPADNYQSGNRVSTERRHCGVFGQTPCAIANSRQALQIRFGGRPRDNREAPFYFIEKRFCLSAISATPH